MVGLFVFGAKVAEGEVVEVGDTGDRRVGEEGSRVVRLGEVEVVVGLFHREMELLYL